MYRLKFSPAIGRWVVQVMVYGMFWSDVRSDAKPTSFEDFDKAKDYVRKVGLDMAYRNHAERPTADLWNGHPQHIPAVIRATRI